MRVRVVLQDSGDLPVGALLERLDVSLIAPTGLLPDTRTFTTWEVRARTAL